MYDYGTLKCSEIIGFDWIVADYATFYIYVPRSFIFSSPQTVIVVSSLEQMNNDVLVAPHFPSSSLIPTPTSSTSKGHISRLDV